MNDNLYRVWINDDDKLNLQDTRETLEEQFPGALEIRTHQYYHELKATIEAWKKPKDQTSESSKIGQPDLVIQDYNYGRFEESYKYCLSSIQIIKENFPSAKIVIATSDEYLKQAQEMMKSQNWDISVMDKIFLDDDARLLVEKIIIDDIKFRYKRL